MLEEISGGKNEKYSSKSKKMLSKSKKSSHLRFSYISPKSVMGDAKEAGSHHGHTKREKETDDENDNE